MKNPRWKEAYPQQHKVKYGGKNLTTDDNWRVLHVNLYQSTSGTINANPLTGRYEDTITLSNTPASHYKLNSYQVSGANLYNTNKFDLEHSDVNVSATWDWVDYTDPKLGPTTRIGNLIWMCRDLNINVGNNTTRDCTYCGVQRYYTFSGATAAAATIGSGWRLPSLDDWYNLFDNCGGKANAGSALKASNGWRSNPSYQTDPYKFSAVGAGVFNAGRYDDDYDGTLVGYWTSNYTYIDQYKQYATQFQIWNGDSNIVNIGPVTTLYTTNGYHYTCVRLCKNAD